MPDIDAARALLGKLRAGRLGNPFRARDVYRSGWAGLSDSRIVHAAIQLLENFGWVQHRVDDHTGGRERADIYIHPDIVKRWKQ
jgi:hypothetical protein